VIGIHSKTSLLVLPNNSYIPLFWHTFDRLIKRTNQRNLYFFINSRAI